MKREKAGARLKSKGKWCLWIPAVLMMILIFRFSAANGDSSNGLSTGLTGDIIHTIENVLNFDLPTDKENTLIEVINTPIRKMGHFSEYALFAITVALPLYVLHNKRRGKLFLWSEGICIVYASTDEFHQLFVSGRSGRFTDVLIDGSGAAFGLLIFLFILLVMNKQTWVKKGIDKK